jgi:hypothetical protein
MYENKQMYLFVLFRLTHPHSHTSYMCMHTHSRMHTYIDTNTFIHSHMLINTHTQPHTYVYV